MRKPRQILESTWPQPLAGGGVAGVSIVEEVAPGVDFNEDEWRTFACILGIWLVHGRPAYVSVARAIIEGSSKANLAPYIEYVPTPSGVAWVRPNMRTRELLVVPLLRGAREREFAQWGGLFPAAAWGKVPGDGATWLSLAKTPSK